MRNLNGGYTSIQEVSTKKAKTVCHSIWDRVSGSRAPEVKAFYKLCILDSRGEQRNQLTSGSFIKFRGQKNGFTKFIGRDYLIKKAYRLLPDDKLTIVCELTVIGKTLHVSDYETDAMSSSDQVIHANVNFENLLDSSTISDVILCSDGREYPAHAAILASGSPVFHAMLRTGMIEPGGKTRRLEVTDVSWDVLIGNVAIHLHGKSVGFGRDGRTTPRGF